MSFWGKKRSKKIVRSNLDENIPGNFEKCSGKVDNLGKKPELHKLTPESSSLCSRETKRFSFFERIHINKVAKKLSKPQRSNENSPSTSISKINLDSSFYYQASTLSPLRNYENIQYTSPTSSIFDKSHIFERSVDYLSLASPSTSVSFTPSVYKSHSVDHAHQQRIVDNHVPTVLDASMEILNDSANMDNVEIIRIKRVYSPTLSSENFQPKDSLTSYTSSLYTRETSLSFISYADLVNVDHCEISSPISTVADGSKLMTLRSDLEHISLKQTISGEEVKRLLSNTDNVSNS